MYQHADILINCIWGIEIHRYSQHRTFTSHLKLTLRRLSSSLNTRKSVVKKTHEAHMLRFFNQHILSSLLPRVLIKGCYHHD